MSKLITTVKRFRQDDHGAAMVEYALMIALVAVVCVVAVTALGAALSGQFTTVTGNV